MMCLFRQILEYSLNEEGYRYCEHSRPLYFKVKESLSNIEPDGDGLNWCSSRDQKYRRHVGLTAKYAYAIQFGKKDYSDIYISVLLIAGDVATNPGPIRCPCKVCGNTVRRNEKGVNCCLCWAWFHRQCIAMAEAYYEKQSTYELLQWRCDECKGSSINTENSSFEEDCTKASRQR